MSKGTFVATCIGCGCCRELSMYPHRHKPDKGIVGWKFACPRCKESVMGAYLKMANEQDGAWSKIAHAGEPQ